MESELVECPRLLLELDAELCELELTDSSAVDELDRLDSVLVDSPTVEVLSCTDELGELVDNPTVVDSPTAELLDWLLVDRPTVDGLEVLRPAVLELVTLDVLPSVLLVLSLN